MSASENVSRHHSRTRCTLYLCYAGIPPRPASAFLLFCGNKNTARMLLVKVGNHGFISTVLADFISLVAGPIAEAELSRHSAEHKYGIRVRLCSDWCLREADGESGLSANSCHCIVRNTIPIFCAALCRDYRFRPILVLLLNFISYRIKLFADLL